MDQNKNTRSCRSVRTILPNPTTPAITYWLNKIKKTQQTPLDLTQVMVNWSLWSTGHRTRISRR